MGICFSCRSSPPFNNIVRVVHLSGYVEDFEEPILVSQITKKTPKHFVCTPSQLLSAGSKPLNSDTLLQPGQIYFLLPFSSLQADVSSLDFALLAKKLIAVAKTSKLEANKSLLQSSPLHIQQCSSPAWSSPARSPNRFEKEDQMGVIAYGSQRSSRARSWKPILDPIREKSFNLRSESELEDNVWRVQSSFK